MKDEDLFRALAARRDEMRPIERATLEALEERAARGPLSPALRDLAEGLAARTVRARTAVQECIMKIIERTIAEWKKRAWKRPRPAQSRAGRGFDVFCQTRIRT